MDLLADPWYDLTYHVLSHLPVAGADASSLFDEAYVRWSDRCLSMKDMGWAGEGAPPRTVAADAALMASLYDASPQGFLLHGWPLLWDDLDAFLRDVRTDFNRLAWPDAERERLAGEIVANTEPALPDLFRTALWSEVQNGYREAWERTVAPRTSSVSPRFARELGSLADALPGLGDPTYVLCHPLRVHGRLLPRGGAAPIIAVGVADEELRVAELHPVVQACHEYFVWRVHCGASHPGPRATVPGREGHDAFAAEENAALAAGARFFSDSDWQGPHRAWLGLLFPDAPPPDTAAFLAAGTTLSPALAAVIDDLLPRG